MIQIGDRLMIGVDREESDFDRACDAAWHRAINAFGIDDYGHSEQVEGFERSTCSINIEFLKYWRRGNWHHYEFDAWVSKDTE